MTKPTAETTETVSARSNDVELTRQREAREALRESEERFRMLADNISQLAWTCDLLGNVTWYNKRWLEYTGLTFEEMKGWEWMKVQHPDHVDRVVARVKRSAETGEPWEDIFPLLGRDGQYRWFLSRALPIRDERGNLIQWFGTNTDITEQMQAQEAQARLAAIVKFSDDAIISKDLNGVITSWNRGAERLFGYTKEEAIGQPVTILMPPERFDEEPGILKRIRCGESIEHYETVRRRKDGTLLDISLTVSPIVNANGEITGASKVARDISERKKQENALRQLKDELEVRVRERTKELIRSQGRLRELASQLTITEQRERGKLAKDLHDSLAQMLAVGQMKISLAMKQLAISPDLKSTLQNVSTIFQQAMSYTRTMIGELMPPSLQDHGLPEALKWLAERFQQDGLSVDVKSDCEKIRLSEELAVMLFQSVRELLFNVIKHAGVDRAAVTLTVDPNGSFRVVVSDRGKGLGEDALQRASEPGHLGLFSVRERLESMGGQVEIASQLGHGTTITLSLPMSSMPSGEP
jgi:PAS domain S-box-containing protein